MIERQNEYYTILLSLKFNTVYLFACISVMFCAVSWNVVLHYLEREIRLFATFSI